MTGEGFAYFRWHQAYWDGAIPFCWQFSERGACYWHMCRLRWERKMRRPEPEAIAAAKNETEQRLYTQHSEAYGPQWGPR
jgi:hypothetical protein